MLLLCLVPAFFSQGDEFRIRIVVWHLYQGLLINGFLLFFDRMYVFFSLNKIKPYKIKKLTIKSRSSISHYWKGVMLRAIVVDATISQLTLCGVVTGSRSSSFLSFPFILAKDSNAIFVVLQGI